jgi:hypothetical protein
MNDALSQRCLSCGRLLPHAGIKFCPAAKEAKQSCQDNFLRVSIRHAEQAIRSGRLSIRDLRRDEVHRS